MAAVSRGQRNSSLIGIEGVVVGHGDYERLTPRAIDLAVELRFVHFEGDGRLVGH